MDTSQKYSHGISRLGLFSASCLDVGTLSIPGHPWASLNIPELPWTLFLVQEPCGGGRPSFVKVGFMPFNAFHSQWSQCQAVLVKIVEIIFSSFFSFSYSCRKPSICNWGRVVASTMGDHCQMWTRLGTVPWISPSRWVQGIFPWICWWILCLDAGLSSWSICWSRNQHPGLKTSAPSGWDWDVWVFFHCSCGRF